jgi:hypothetical protein
MGGLADAKGSEAKWMLTLLGLNRSFKSPLQPSEQQLPGPGGWATGGQLTWRLMKPHRTLVEKSPEVFGRELN